MSAENSDAATRLQRVWDKQARFYDKTMGFWDRLLFRDSRHWACSQAGGDVLEVAVGTGLNLTFYPDGTAFTGLDFSPNMLAHARARAASLNRNVELIQGDAHNLPFGDHTFDTVVCTFGLCAIADMNTALTEMHRVLRPDGRLILADHVESTSPVARAVQRLIESVTVRVAGEHFTRHPAQHLAAHGFRLENQQRYALGIVERITARKDGARPAAGLS